MNIFELIKSYKAQKSNKDSQSNKSSLLFFILGIIHLASIFLKMKLVFGIFVMIAMTGATQALLGKCQWDCDKDSDCQSGLLCADAHKSELKQLGIDERKADCTGYLGAWNEEVCFDSGLLRPSGGGGGGTYQHKNEFTESPIQSFQ